MHEVSSIIEASANRPRRRTRRARGQKSHCSPASPAIPHAPKILINAHILLKRPSEIYVICRTLQAWLNNLRQTHLRERQ